MMIIYDNNISIIISYHIYNTQLLKKRFDVLHVDRPKLFDVVSLSPDAGDTWGPLRNGARESQRWEARLELHGRWVLKWWDFVVNFFGREHPGGISPSILDPPRRDSVTPLDPGHR